MVRVSQVGTLAVRYGYGADGERLWKKVGSEVQIWLDKIYEEKQGKTLFHVFAGDQRVCTFESGSALAVSGGGGASTHVGYYYHQDHLTSSSALSGSAGEVLERNDWYPFGRTQVASPQAPLQVSSRFTGQIFDAETGLYYYGSRYFDPELGRFVQPDTVIPELGNPQSYNRYSYVMNNPLRYVDPDGHRPYDVFYYQNRIPHTIILDVKAGNLRAISGYPLTPNMGAVNAVMVAGEYVAAGALAAAPEPASKVGAAILFLDATDRAQAMFRGTETCYYKAAIWMADGDTELASRGVFVKDLGIAPLAMSSFLPTPIRSANIPELLSVKSLPTGPGNGIGPGAAHRSEFVSSSAARREVMRRAGIPTSQQPKSQMKNIYEVNGQRWAVTQQTTDRVPGHGPHWEAGRVKPPSQYGLDKLGRQRVFNEGKVKVNYGGE